MTTLRACMRIHEPTDVTPKRGKQNRAHDHFSSRRWHAKADATNFRLVRRGRALEPKKALFKPRREVSSGEHYRNGVSKAPPPTSTTAASAILRAKTEYMTRDQRPATAVIMKTLGAARYVQWRRICRFRPELVYVVCTAVSVPATRNY